MRNSIKAVITALVLFAAFQGCKQKTKVNDSNYISPNQNRILVDESLQPIVDEELYVFKSMYDNVHPVVSYAPENSVVNLFLNDSVRIALLSRGLTKQENKVLSDRHAMPMISTFAVDAIAIIVNQASTDTNFTVSEIKKMLNGYTKQDKDIVFDNPNSGLVRYLKDFSGNKDFKQKNIYALKSNKEVIKYVADHPNAIGFTGFGWLNDPDKDYADAVQKVKIAGVKDDVTKNAANEYFTPSQNTLALKQYPLTRFLYIFRTTSDLGLKFDAFVMSDQGQRIILKSGLLPDSIPSRKINIVKTMKTTDK